MKNSILADECYSFHFIIMQRKSVVKIYAKQCKHTKILKTNCQTLFQNKQKFLIITGISYH